MYKLLRLVGTFLIAVALTCRGLGTVLASGYDRETEPIALLPRSAPDSLEEESGDDDDGDTPPTDNDGFDTPQTDYDGVDTPATDNDGVDTPLSTDDDGINTPYTDYDGVDAPGIPTLRAEAKGAAIELSWNATAASKSYDLWAWEETNGWRELGGANLNATIYTDTEVAPETTYLYTIRGVGGPGETSAWSSYVSATTETPGSITVAPVLSAVSGSSHVALSWNRVAGADRYELWAWDDVNKWRQIGGDNLTGTSHQHAGLSAGDSFYYAIRAVDGSGNPGPWSKYANATVGSTSAQSTSTPTSTPTPTLTATSTSNRGASPRSLPGVGPGSDVLTATPTLTSTATPTFTPTPTATAGTSLQQLLPPVTDYDGYDTPATDNDGISTPFTTDNDGFHTPYTDYDGTSSDGTDSDGTDSDGIDTPTPTDNDGTDSDGIDTPTPTDNDGTDSDGIDTPTPTDNDGTDSDGIDTPTPTDNDGTDSDGIDTPTPSPASSVSGASSVSN